MNDNTNFTDADYVLTTQQFAALNNLRAESVRQQLYRSGSYMGVVPKRQANGRLLFPAVKPLSDNQPGGEKR